MKLDGKEIEVGDMLFVLGRGYLPVRTVSQVDCSVEVREGYYFHFGGAEDTKSPGYRMVYWEAPDIAPKPLPASKTFWLNVYKKDIGVYHDKHLADLYADDDRIACKKVTIEYVPGEFDE